MSVWLGVLFNIGVTVAAPVLLLGYFMLRKRPLVRPFLIGAATFIFFQIATRIPLLELVLKKQMWFQSFSRLYPWLYLLFLAFTAGLFEEVGRYITMRLFLKNKHEWQDGVAFGLGHGGVEALLLVGVSNIALLFNPAYLQMLSFGQVAPAGVERISTVILHVGFSLLVITGIRRNKKGYLLAAIATHTAVDFLFPAMMMLGVPTWGIEVALLVVAAVTLIFILKSKNERKAVSGA